MVELDKVIQQIGVFKTQFDNLSNEVGALLLKHSLKLESIIKIDFDLKTVEEKLEEKKSTLEKNVTKLGVKNVNGFLNKKQILSNEIKELTNQLDLHSKNYQNYIDRLKIWEEVRTEILGSIDKEGSIEFLNSQLVFISKDLQKEIDRHVDARKELLVKLFAKKEEKLELYKTMFKPVTDFIDSYGSILGSYNINVDVDYKINGFVEKFIDHINLGAKGSFINSIGGTERIKSIIQKHEMNSIDGIKDFLNEVSDNLKYDRRDEAKGEKRDIAKQLKKGYSVHDLYSFMYNLDYLEPEYKLKLGQKNLSELSPGERGALLLIFYLTLDQNDIPLVIDQPEENLDNQSVYKILVQFIKEAKEKRQIIIVTHNPNLAVACNAEQIVHVTMDKLDGNQVNIISGSLENKVINDAVIDILEGTFPALNTRTGTYKIINR